MKKIDKKRAIISSIFFIVGALCMILIRMYCIQHGYNYCRKIDGFYNMSPLLNSWLCFSGAFFLSSFMSQKIYTIWLKFSIIYYIIVAFLIIITPKEGDYFTPDGFDKYLISVVLNIGFILISAMIFSILTSREKKEK